MQEARALVCAFARLFVARQFDTQETTKSGPASARQWNAIKMSFLLWADDDQTLYAGCVSIKILCAVSYKKNKQKKQVSLTNATVTLHTNPWNHE